MPQRGVLLVNLGSPASPAIADVRRYLNEFLMDPFVIDSPWLIRRIVVSGLILSSRTARTAQAYRRIWEPTGSPLLRHSRALRDAVARLTALPVALAMRYGEPRIESAVKSLLDAGVEEILLVALYPHHADSTRTTAIRAVREQLERLDARVSLAVVPPFFSHPGYLAALSASIARSTPAHSQLLLFSYHGLPERHLVTADPSGAHCLKTSDCCERPSPAHATCYRHQVLETSRAVAQRLRLTTMQWRVGFQSRVGRLPWLTPYTDRLLDALPVDGIKHLTIACPAFVADNLETLEEIGVAGRERFRAAGGESLTLIPCLNDDPAWVETVAAWCLANENNAPPFDAH